MRGIELPGFITEPYSDAVGRLYGLQATVDPGVGW